MFTLIDIPYTPFVILICIIFCNMRHKFIDARKNIESKFGASSVTSLTQKIVR